MPRGVKVATVVPTAFEDCGEATPSRHIHASSSGREEDNRYSSDATSNNNPAEPITETASGKYLEAAFNNQISSSHEYLMSAFNGQSSTSSTTNGDDGNSISFQQQNTGAPGVTPPLVGKPSRQSSQSVILQKQGGAELTKNYLEFAKDFRQLRPFTRLPDGTYPENVVCVYCSKTKPTSVFFPCQHMCACNNCIHANNISTGDASPSDWSACPICMDDIRLILPHTGKEEEEYWEWVLEIKPTLPSQFTKKFRAAGKRLTMNAAPAQDRTRSFVTMFFREGAFKTNSNPLNLEPESSAPVPSRRHSWQPGADASTVQNVVAPSGNNCSIL